MGKEKKIIGYFIGWLVILIFICFVGISNVFALEYTAPNYIQFYDNTGSALNALGATCGESGCSSDETVTLVAGSYGGAIALQLEQQLIKGYNYSISISLTTGLPNMTDVFGLSSKNYIGIGNTVTNAKNNYINQTGVTINSSYVTRNVIYYNFNVTSSINSQYILIPFTGKNTLTDINIGYLGMELINNGTGLSSSDITNITNNQTTELNNSIQNSTDTITGEIDDMEQSIIDSNKETQEVIKDQFNDCYMNLLNWTRPAFGTIIENDDGSFNWSYPYAQNFSMDLTGKLNSGTYTLSNFGDITLYIQKNASDYTNSVIGNGNYKTFYYDGTSYLRLIYAATTPDKSQLFKLSLVSGNISKPYSPYGEEICTNKIDEQVETSKGIWASIRDLPNAFMNMLKGLFIPDDEYFEEWFNDLKTYFELKLGFLGTPFTIIIDFVNRYLELDPQDDIIINIPNITVPNFEDHIIVHATTFNWSELLKSKESLNMLWELYLSFVDVFLILNFIGLCETKYNRIFGGDTTPYEYYTTEDSYMFDTDTGEITKMGVHKEKRTTRKKVN